MSTTPYTIEYYKDLITGSRRSDEIVVPLALRLVNPRSVVDSGCGLGSWLAVFREYGIHDILGVDGDYVDRTMLEIPANHFLPFDLRAPLYLGRRFDLALSIEVAEHLPAECAGTFVSSLVRLAPVVLFSAAIPYQGGTDHINEQWPEYWAGLFNRHGYVVADPIRQQVWDNPEVEWWYAQNLIVFIQASHLGNYPDVREAKHGLSIVHPRKYLQDLLMRSGSRDRLSVRGASKKSNGPGNWLRGLWARMCPPDERP